MMPSDGVPNDFHVLVPNDYQETTVIDPLTNPASENSTFFL
jgi:hypothetical protein